MTEYVLTDADAPPSEDRPADEPIWDLIAEQSVLGGMMLSATVVQDVVDQIKPDDFYQPKHELIALAIGTLVSRGEPADAITVAEELRRTGKLERAGGAAYMHELTSVVPTPAHAGHYAVTVRELAAKRRLVEAGTRITGMGRASEGDSESLLESARVELDKVTTGRRKPVRAMGESFDALIESLDSEPTFIPSPWESLNKLIGGFQPGAFYVFGARPSGGKSIAVLQCAAELAHTGMVAMSSLEMTEIELQTRLVAQYGQVHMTALRNRSLSQDDWERVAEARKTLMGVPIFVDETPGVSMGNIRAHARTVARKGPLAGIIIDYLQLVTGDGRRERREQVDEIAWQAKQLAKDLNVPVIAAAQLKRAGGRKGLPTMDDLREAGGIENSADVVILLDRDKEKKPNDLQMVVVKNRHGASGKFTLRWQAEFSRLRDKQWSPTALFEDEQEG